MEQGSVDGHNQENPQRTVCSRCGRKRKIDQKRMKIGEKEEKVNLCGGCRRSAESFDKTLENYAARLEKRMYDIYRRNKKYIPSIEDLE